jgi:hypothetical protein
MGNVRRVGGSSQGIMSLGGGRIMSLGGGILLSFRPFYCHSALFTVIPSHPYCHSERSRGISESSNPFLFISLALVRHPLFDQLATGY